MNLGPVSYLDCLVFCICLAPQLLLHVGLFGTVGVVLRCLPFLLYKLPVSFVYEHFFQPREEQTPFVRTASGFEDFVVRCVRFAFASIPPQVGRVFFSRPVALPFLRFRMLRHGCLRWPFHWKQATDSRFKGVWMIKDPMKPIDVCIFYAHGGGFSMGSPYFYLEYLLTWLSLLGESGYSNPAIFSLEYTLVPDAVFPAQLHQAITAYRHVLGTVGKASRVCISGDSAGATIMLSLLLHLANPGHDADKMNDSGTWRLEAPAMAALISPWVTLVSPKHRNTASDYLNQDNLHQYALEYAGRQAVTNPLLSPGDCRDVNWWQRACPSGGLFFAYGAEEVLAPDIKDFVKFLETAGVKISSRAEDGGIHAWPVASLFLSTGARDRQKGLKSLVEQITLGIPPAPV